MPFDPLSEIKTSDKVMEVNKNKTMENVINSHLYRCLIFSPVATESLFKRHLTLTYRGLIYAKKCLKEPSKSFLKSKLVNLVDAKRKKLGNFNLIKFFLINLSTETENLAFGLRRNNRPYNHVDEPCELKRTARPHHQN